MTEETKKVLAIYGNEPPRADEYPTCHVVGSESIEARPERGDPARLHPLHRAADARTHRALAEAGSMTLGATTIGSTQMTEEPVEVILPCPFCGGDTLRRSFTRATETFAFWSVECAECGVEVADDESQEAADRAWNRRAPSAEKQALIEALEKIASYPANNPRSEGLVDIARSTLLSMRNNGNG